MEGIKDFDKRLETLTPKERMYFSIMRAKSGVLKISAKPGVAKTAIARSIAKKMGFEYIDARMGDTGHYSCPVFMLKTF